MGGIALTYEEIYQKAYALLDTVTPLKSDCGVLCDHACCKGDENQGMRLFPGETTTLPCKSVENGHLVVCNGQCDRTQRPLACRIFPFFPVLHPDGHVSAEIDTRALSLCPLTEHCDRIHFDPEFLKAIRRVGVLLSQKEDCRQFLKETAEEIRIIGKLQGFEKRYSRRKGR